MSTRSKIVDVVGFVWKKFMQNMVRIVPNMIKQIVVHIGNKLRQHKFTSRTEQHVVRMLQDVV